MLLMEPLQRAYALDTIINRLTALRQAPALNADELAEVVQVLAEVLLAQNRATLTPLDRALYDRSHGVDPSVTVGDGKNPNERSPFPPGGTPMGRRAW